MNKILIAAAVVLMAGTSLASAATPAPVNTADLTGKRCSYVERQLSEDRAAYKSEAAFQAAQERAMSLCHKHNHKQERAGVPSALGQ